MDKKGKITISVIIISLILLIFSLYFIWAADSITKVYDEETETISIKDNSVEIAKIILNTPKVYNVMRGNDRLVAEFTIENFKASSDVFENLEFYDVKDDLNKIERQFNYKYKTYYDVEVPDYEISCKDRLSVNGSVEKYDCVQNQIGSHTEQMVQWNSFDENAELPEGIITIGIFTDVYPNERVEWIPTLFGARIDEWAEWTEGLNLGLTHVYQFNETSGTNSLDSRGRDIGNQYNFTLKNGATFRPGISGNGIYCDGINDYADTSGGVIGFPNGTDEWTMSFWYNDSSSVVTWAEMILRDQGTEEFLAFAHGTYNLNFYVTGGNTYYYVGSSSTADKWFFVTLVRNSTSISGFINGTLVQSAENTASIDSTGNLQLCSATGIAINANFSGMFDEIYIWNRSLSDSEISDLYNNGDGITYTNLGTGNYTINFNLTNADTGEQIDTSGPQVDFGFSCDNGFSVSNVDNPYTAVNFGNGNIECTFYAFQDADEIFYFNEVQIITVDSNKTVEVQMSPSFGLSQEEHDWLEAIHNCLINGVGCA